MFRNIPLQTSTAHLLLNCFLQKETPSPNPQTAGMKIYPVKFEKCASTLPNIWINGYFNQSTGYVCNPQYILRQEISHDLLANEESSIWKKFHETYPEEAYRALHIANKVQNFPNTEYEK